MTEQKIMNIPIDRIIFRVNEDNQAIWPYRDEDKTHIESLVSKNEPHTWKEIQVVPKDFHFNPNGYFYLLDGRHRLKSAHILNAALSDEGLPQTLSPYIKLIYELEDHIARNGAYKPITAMTAIVRTDIKDDLQATQAMFDANVRHGKAPSKKERIDHLRWLFENFPQLKEESQEKLAQRIGASQQTVSRLLNELEDDEENYKSSNKDFNRHSRALIRQLVKVHQMEGSFFTGNKMSGSFKKVVLEEMANDKDTNKAIRVLARSLNDVVETIDAR